MKDNILTPIESPGRRAAAYWFVDGLPELVFGITMLIFGIWMLLSIEQDWKRWWVLVGALIAALLFFSMFVVHRRILDFLKTYITYPRTGYVRPPADFPGKENSLDKILTLGMAHEVSENISTFRGHTVYLFVLGFVCLQILRANWAIPAVMTAIAAGLYFWNRDDVRPYSWLAVSPIALAGFVAAGFDLKPESRWYVPLVIGGAWLVGIGTWTLVHYLRTHPEPKTGQADRP